MARREYGVTVFRLPVHEPTQAEVDATLQLFLFAVAMRAVLLQDRTDLRLVVWLVRRTLCGGGNKAGAEQDERMTET
jgi:hypothetical protein